MNLENLSSLWKLVYLMFHSNRVTSKLPTLTKGAALQLSEGFVPAGSLVKNTGSKFYPWTEITDIISSPVCQPAQTWQGKKKLQRKKAAKTTPGRVLQAEMWAQGGGNLCWCIKCQSVGVLYFPLLLPRALGNPTCFVNTDYGEQWIEVPFAARVPAAAWN